MKDIKTDIVDTPAQIRALVDRLVARHTSPMYLDLEGKNLSRDGTLSIITLLLDTDPAAHVYLIDIHTLGTQAFTTPGTGQKTLKHILEDAAIPKVFFDVRNDSDALFAHFAIALRGVEDLQLMESATRRTTPSRRLLSGLAKCIEQKVFGAQHTPALAAWKSAKEKGERLFKPELGGSGDVFDRRPITVDIAAYCVGDVRFLPALRRQFGGATARWAELVREEAERRVIMSQRADYEPHSREKAKAPWTKAQNALLDQWNYVVSISYRDEGDDPFDDEDGDDDDDYWYHDYPTSCRDIIPDWDMHLYYSD